MKVTALALINRFKPFLLKLLLVGLLVGLSEVLREALSYGLQKTSSYYISTKAIMDTIIVITGLVFGSTRGIIIAMISIFAAILQIFCTAKGEEFLKILIFILPNSELNIIKVILTVFLVGKVKDCKLPFLKGSILLTVAVLIIPTLLMIVEIGLEWSDSYVFMLCDYLFVYMIFILVYVGMSKTKIWH